MAKTLLDCVNEILIRLQRIQGQQAALTSLTDSARQLWIDVSVQVINEGIDSLYDASHVRKPIEVSNTDITLTLLEREYTLPTDMVQLRWPGLDETNGLFVEKYPGDYDQLRKDQPRPDDGYLGRPLYGVINPLNDKLRFDHRPTAEDVGRVYRFEYDKDLVLTTATDTVPFRDAAFRAMIPAWAQLVQRDLKRDFDAAIFERQLGQAARFINEEQRRTTWS